MIFNRKKPDRAIIDVHSHPSMPLYQKLVEETNGLAPELRYPYRTFLPPKLPNWTPQFALDVMGQEGIRAQVLSLPDATVELRGESARKIARQINEALAQVISDNPSRFGAYGVVPHDDTDSTLAEIEYALDVLKLDGVCTVTNIRGTYLGDPQFDPWLDELHRRSAVLFVHPTLSADMIALSPLFMEFCFDSSRMVMNMVLSGRKRQFPNIKIISTHGGGAIPYISHRLEMIEPIIGRSGMTEQQISEDLRSFYYDLTSCMAPVPLSAMATFANPTRLLMGFDFPYAPPSFIKPEVERLFASEEMTEQDKSMIVSTNALKLFPRLASYT